MRHEDAVALLKGLGVTSGQGFLLGAPEPWVERLEPLVASADAARAVARPGAARRRAMP